MASRSEIYAGHSRISKYLENAESAAANEFLNNVWEFTIQSFVLTISCLTIVDNEAAYVTKYI
jgi:hypothetical protein